MISGMTQTERDSIVIGGLSTKHKYYDENADISFIQEISFYDDELDSTYIAHISLPPGYDESKTYPMFMMTDDVWWLNYHIQLRQMMSNGEIENIILISFGPGYERDAADNKVRAIEFVQKQQLYLNFITNNLVPYICELYNINNKRSAIMGHSLGGLFTYYAVFNHDKYENQPFQYYIISSPSLWVSQYGFMKGYSRPNQNDHQSKPIEEYFRRNQVFNKSIYLNAGDKEKILMSNYIRRFNCDAEKYGIKTMDYELFKGNHISFLDDMVRKALLKFYGSANQR